jgi:hypothetical protein
VWKSGHCQFPITRAASALPKKEKAPRTSQARGATEHREENAVRENMLRSQMTRGVPVPSVDSQYNVLIALISILRALPEETETIDI